jgi:hypothetical protein
MLDEQARQSLRDVRGGLQWILGVLSGKGHAIETFTLRAPLAVARPSARKASPAGKTKTAKKAVKRRRR